jgi:hypothetical protein
MPPCGSARSRDRRTPAPLLAEQGAGRIARRRASSRAEA